MIFLHISVSRLIPLIGHVITVFTITEAKVELINDIYQEQPITCEQKIKNVLSINFHLNMHKFYAFNRNFPS